MKKITGLSECPHGANTFVNIFSKVLTKLKWGMEYKGTLKYADFPPFQGVCLN